MNLSLHSFFAFIFLPLCPEEQKKNCNVGFNSRNMINLLLQNEKEIEKKDTNNLPLFFSKRVGKLHESNPAYIHQLE